MPEYSKSVKRHLLPCEHCRRDVLDHMTQCPFCGGTLTPRGYQDRGGKERTDRIRRVLNWLGLAILAIVGIIWLMSR